VQTFAEDGGRELAVRGYAFVDAHLEPAQHNRNQSVARGGSIRQSCFVLFC
jgi:hypothetical protein